MTLPTWIHLQVVSLPDLPAPVHVPVQAILELFADSIRRGVAHRPRIMAKAVLQLSQRRWQRKVINKARSLL
jgi:hypothetical protein